MATKKNKVNTVICPHCNQEVPIIPQSEWNELVKYYIPACPHCATSFKRMFTKKSELFEYIGYKVDLAPNEDIEEIETIEEKEW